MRFEHLIQINDPLMPLLDTLTREQLWRGLVMRAEEPTQFVLGLEVATIHSRSEVGDEVELVRTLDFGSFKVDDRVRLVPQRRSEIHTHAGLTWPASRMTIEIEEPQPELLFLRFIYESDEMAGEGRLDEVTAALRQQAYERADLDTVARIRALAEDGWLAGWFGRAPPGMHSKALVLFSGGQDSTTCLAWALHRYPHVEMLESRAS